MLKVTGLTITRSGREIIKDLSFSLEQGASLAVMGPSGCGKTTLLKAVAGFCDILVKGQISNNQTLWQDRSKLFLSARQRPTTLLFQEFPLAVWPHLTVKQQLDLVHPKGPNSKTSPSTIELIQALGLGYCSNTIARNLSGGEKQRLALGRALKTEPSILLLDEPFASLDLTTKAEITDLVKKLRDRFNFSLILSTHNPEEPRQLSAKTLFLA